MNVIFFGTPSFAAEILKVLLKNRVKVSAVVTRPDKPKGRHGAPVPSAVKQVALEEGLPLFQPDRVSTETMISRLKTYQADLFLVVAFGEILSQELIDVPKIACLNVHPSMLPKYRGAAPIQRCLMHGDKETGVTIMHMVRKMDAGPILHQVPVTIEDDEPFGQLEERLCQIGATALLEVIQGYENGHPSEHLQDESKVTYAPKIEFEDCQIDWTKSSHEIHCFVRALNPYPGAWTEVKVKGQTKRLKIFQVMPSKFNVKPKDMVKEGDAILIGCGEGALCLGDVQLEGKIRMSARDLFRGNQIEFI